MTEEFEVVHHIDLLMRKINVEMHYSVPQVDTERVGPLGTMVITVLQATQPVPIQSLVKYLNRDKSQITRIIQLLESKELISKRKSEEDGRIELLALTKRGEVFASKLEMVLQRTVNEVMTPLNSGERQVFIDILRKLT